MLENKIKLYFLNSEKVTAVYLFGSHAAGKARAVLTLTSPFSSKQETLIL